MSVPNSGKEAVKIFVSNAQCHTIQIMAIYSQTVQKLHKKNMEEGTEMSIKVAFLRYAAKEQCSFSL